ncbi:MAG: hypothetical protein R2715_20140 [Ilumatobacteraceae bacterium]
MAFVPLATSASATGETQVTIFDQIVTHKPNSYAQPAISVPADWTQPVDYKNGRAYLRFEVLEKPSDLALKVQFCLWRNRYTQEICSPLNDFTSTGLYWFDLGVPATWWKLNKVWDFTSPAFPGRLMIKDPASGKLLMTGSCGANCYTGTENLADHTPIKINASMVLVAKNATLTPPANWQGCPTNWAATCGNLAPIVNAGPDLTASADGTPIALEGSVSDDGQPASPGVTSAQWAVVSGPGAVTFADATSATTTASFNTPGRYVLGLTGNDGALSVTDTVTVVALPVGGGGDVRLVVGLPKSPTVHDRAMKTWLTEAGFTVTLTDDNGISKAVLDDADLVVISSTVSPSLIPAWIAAVDSPILSSEPYIGKKLGLANTGIDLSAQKKIKIVDPDSPLAAGTNGLVQTQISNSVIGGLKGVDPDVSIVATAATNAAVATIVHAEAGDPLNTGAAPAARVGFFFGYDAPNKTNAVGRQLFDAAVSLLTYSPPAPPAARPWWDTAWRYRVPVEAATGAFARTDDLAEVDLDLAPVLAGESLDPSSLRVVELDADGAVLAADLLPVRSHDSGRIVGPLDHRAGRADASRCDPPVRRLLRHSRGRARPQRVRRSGVADHRRGR